MTGRAVVAQLVELSDILGSNPVMSNIHLMSTFEKTKIKKRAGNHPISLSDILCSKFIFLSMIVQSDIISRMRDASIILIISVRP